MNKHKLVAQKLLGVALTLSLSLSLLPMAAFATNTEVAINESNFPDKVFNRYIRDNFDTNKNGTLSQEEINKVTDISVQPSFGLPQNIKIKDFKGIEYFTALEVLNCTWNPLTSLDVSKNTALKKLYCVFCGLNELDVSHNPALTELVCDSNNLKSLDVSKNPELTRLSCLGNQLTSLDLSANPKLVNIQCFLNHLAVNTNPFDLSTLPGFQVSKASDWRGGTVSGTILTFADGASEVSYQYDCGQGHVESFTLMLDSEPSEPESNGFTDVSTDDYYYDAVQWAVENGITKGMTDTEFGPNFACTRGQIVTFLWAAAGKPAPASMNNPFVDVSSEDYYYKAVLWAVEKGITKGMTDTTFGPNVTCTRGQTMTFLWASKNKPIVSSNTSFSDVSSSDYYYDAVRWAVANKVTEGVGGNRFCPSQTCTRGQIVTFLYKTAD